MEDREKHIEGAIECPTCNSIYQVDQRPEKCENCGAVLPDAPQDREHRNLAVGKGLKNVVDGVDEAWKNSGMMKEVGQPSLKEQVEGSVICGWCGTKYDRRPDDPNCSTCAGPLPLPPSADPGPAPPPAPRQLPKSFKHRLFVKQNLGGMIGLGMVVLSIPLCCMVIVSVPLFAVGAIIGGWNFLIARRRYVALQKGTHVLGKIETIKQYGKGEGGYETMYQVYFRFEANGNPVKGMKYTYDESIKNHFIGEPVWVVYMPKNPKCCAIWPPLA